VPTKLASLSQFTGLDWGRGSQRMRQALLIATNPSHY
jgi:hypothetical protein